MSLDTLVKQFSDTLLRLTLSATLAFAPACSGDKPPPPPPVATTPSNPPPAVVKTNVSGNTFYSGTTIPVSGVTVSIDNVVNTTGSTGSFSLQDIVVGSKPLKAEKTGYDPYQQTLNIAQGMQPIDIEMTSAQFTFSLTGTIKSSINNQPLQGATITLLNPNNTLSKLSSTSDAQGYYQIPTVPQGQRTVRFQLNNYTSQDIQIFIANTNNKYDLVMNPSGNVVLPSQITKNEVLKVYNSPYILDTDLTIKRGAKLTIEPGVELRIAPQKNIIVEGSLEVLGTPTQPARLTTKNSNPQTTDYWGSLIFNSNTLMQTTNLENLVIEYADKGVTFADLGLNALQMPTITQLKIQKCNTGIIFTGLREYKVVLNNISIDKTNKGIVLFYDPNSFNNEYEFSNLAITNSTVGISYDGDIKNMPNTGVSKDLSLILNNSTITTSEVSGKGIIIPRLILNNCTIQYNNRQQQSDGSGVEVVFLKGTGTNLIKGYKDGVVIISSLINNYSYDISQVNIKDCSAGVLIPPEYFTSSDRISTVNIDNCDYGILGIDPLKSIYSPNYRGELTNSQITNCLVAGILRNFASIDNCIIDNCDSVGVIDTKTINRTIIRNSYVGMFSRSGRVIITNSRFSSNVFGIVAYPTDDNINISNTIFHENKGASITGGGENGDLEKESLNTRHPLTNIFSPSKPLLDYVGGFITIKYCTFVNDASYIFPAMFIYNNDGTISQYESINIIDNIFYIGKHQPFQYNPKAYNFEAYINIGGYSASSFPISQSISSGHHITIYPGTPLFVDKANGDFHLKSSSPFKTSTGEDEIGAYANNGTPP